MDQSAGPAPAQAGSAVVIARRIVVSIAKLALIAAAGSNLLYLIAATPVGNVELRQAGPSGDWRTTGTTTLYDTASYDRQLALDYFLEVARTGEDDLSASVREAARASLRRAPGDPLAWHLLGWGEMLSGDDSAALAALRKSWELAPHSVVLSRDRLLLAEMIGAAALANTDGEIRGALERDVASLRRGDQTSADMLPNIAPTVVSVVSSAVPVE